MEKQKNTAQRLLIAIGGTAMLVGGWDDNWYADKQTPAKPRRARPGQVGPGKYGRNLMSHFDDKRKDRT